MSLQSEHRNGPSGLSRFFRRGPWENFATFLIALGIFMLMQPFSIDLFSYSFAVILTGTVGFVIVSHFPE
ncbi:hypothetical protein [Pelagibius sp. Alg239-R121]|uniref:hypothetical protein n=1 Tax=Pelagibius sp. Alg239-R121 TaxID=2993448 RepID=UPI0024A668DB|nr:hypothetical protein [Pelagibius sp. Alg239-R121]